MTMDRICSFGPGSDVVGSIGSLFGPREGSRRCIRGPRWSHIR